jgi:SAM-dependent methyltransferase
MPALEEVPCAVCESSNHLPVLVLNPRDPAAPGLGLRTSRSRWVICRQCGLVFQSPRPTQAILDRLYLEGEYHERRGGIPEHYVNYSLRRPQPALHWAFDELKALPGRGTALDFGCGIGGALVDLRQRGWDAVGVEPDPHLSAEGRDRFGVDIRTGYFSAETFPQGFAVDLVFSCHVLEHVADPLAILTASKLIAATTGHLLIVIPTFRKARTMAWSYFGFAHNYLFTDVSLGNLMRLAGFEPIAHRYAGGSGDSELWMVGRVAPGPLAATGQEPASAIRREIALVPLGVPLGVPARIRKHAHTLRTDPEDFARRLQRRVSFLGSRARGFVRR